eukprot:208489_1
MSLFRLLLHKISSKLGKITYKQNRLFCTRPYVPSTALLSISQLHDNKLVITDAIKPKIEALSSPTFLLGFIGPSRVGKSTIANSLGLYLSSINNQNAFTFNAGDNNKPVTEGINAGFIMKSKTPNPNIPDGNFMICDNQGIDGRSSTSEPTSRFLMTFCSALIIVSRDGTKYLDDLQGNLFEGLPPEIDLDQQSFCDTLIYIMNGSTQRLGLQEFNEAFEDLRLKRLSDQFPNRTLIRISHVNTDDCGKTDDELDEMSYDERNALLQPVIEKKISQQFEKSKWNQIERYLKPISLFNENLDGDQILMLMNSVCKEFSGDYVIMNKNTQKEIFRNRAADYVKICAEAYKTAMQSLKNDQYKVPIGILTEKNAANQNAATTELDACFTTGLFADTSNEVAQIIKENAKHTLQQQIDLEYQDVIKTNNNKKILPPQILTDKQPFGNGLPDDSFKIESIYFDDSSAWINALVVICGGNYSIPAEVLRFDKVLNADKIFYCDIAKGKWDHLYSHDTDFKSKVDGNKGVHFKNLRLKGSISGIGDTSGTYEGENISQNKSASNTFAVSTTNGKQMTFELSGDLGSSTSPVRAGFKHGIKFTDSKTQTLTKNYSYGYTIDSVPYISFKAVADIQLSIDWEDFTDYTGIGKLWEGMDDAGREIGRWFGDKNVEQSKGNRTASIQAKVTIKVPTSQCKFEAPK